MLTRTERLLWRNLLLAALAFAACMAIGGRLELVADDDQRVSAAAEVLWP